MVSRSLPPFPARRRRQISAAIDRPRGFEDAPHLKQPDSRVGQVVLHAVGGRGDQGLVQGGVQILDHAVPLDLDVVLRPGVPELGASRLRSNGRRVVLAFELNGGSR